MKNKLVTGLLSVLGFAALLITLSYCNADNELSPSKVYKEEIKVQSEHVTKLNESYATFVNSLNATQKSLIATHVSENQAKAENAKTNVEAKCECAPGQSTCSASSWFSSCCICWNPETQTGACGEYWGVAICKTENNPQSEERGVSKSEPTIIKFYPNRFSDMLKIASENGASTKAIDHELSKLVSLAEAE